MIFFQYIKTLILRNCEGFIHYTFLTKKYSKYPKNVIFPILKDNVRFSSQVLKHRAVVS